MVQGLQCLSSKCKALSSNSVSPRKKKILSWMKFSVIFETLRIPRIKRIFYKAPEGKAGLTNRNSPECLNSNTKSYKHNKTAVKLLGENCFLLEFYTQSNHHLSMRAQWEHSLIGMDFMFLTTHLLRKFLEYVSTKNEEYWGRHGMQKMELNTGEKASQFLV
jgi:hypothetical protein